MSLALARTAVLLALSACATIGGGAGGDDDDDSAPPTDEETPPCTTACEIDGLDSTLGCGGVYNPDQILDYHFTMKASDWTSVKNDSTYVTYYPAQFQCGSDAPLPFQIGVRRKRGGDGTKPSFKVNFHEYEIGGSFFSLKKFSFEIGKSSTTTNSGAADRREIMSEYLAWRMMVLSKQITSRAAFARVYVNGEFIGTYVNVEQVDKRFLRFRGQDDEGWLWKQSNNPGYKTNETTPNPYHDRLCFWDAGGACAAKSAQELATYLPMHLDIDQMLHLGAVNAFLANHDGPLAKANNYYYYDDPMGAPRLYIPWDLDTSQKQTDGVFAFRVTSYTDVLFTNWEDDYDQVLTALLAGPLAMAVINAELDRIGTVAAAAIDEDTHLTGTFTATSAIQSLRMYWTNRHAQISAEIAAHAP